MVAVEGGGVAVLWGSWGQEKKRGCRRGDMLMFGDVVEVRDR